MRGGGGVQQSGSLMMVVDAEMMYGVFAFGWQTVWGGVVFCPGRRWWRLIGGAKAGRQTTSLGRSVTTRPGGGRASPHEANHRKIVESSEARASSSLSTPTSSTTRQLRGDRSNCLTHPHQKSVSAPSSAPFTLSLSLCVLRACLACGPASLQRARAPHLAHRLPPL